MALQLTIQPVGPLGGGDSGQSTLTVVFTITALNSAFGGNPGGYTALGDILDFTQLGDALQSNSVPLQVSIQSQPPAGTTASGFLYNFCKGTTLKNCKMQVFQSAGAGNPHSELPAGNYPGGILTDTIVGVAYFGTRMY